MHDSSVGLKFYTTKPECAHQQKRGMNLMADHGFGTGKLGTGLNLFADTKNQDKIKIAKCIAKIDEVLWSHVVQASTGGTGYDLLWEMTKNVKDKHIPKLTQQIEKCASDQGYTIEIGWIRIEDDSYTRDDSNHVIKKKHPKKEKP